MSFGNKSDVKNHLSTKHPMFPHKPKSEEALNEKNEPAQETENNKDAPANSDQKPLVPSS
jgi:hypothetical protein